MGLEWLQGVFGDKVLQFVMILFTYETEENYDTINDDLKNNPGLEQLLEKCGGRYQTCNKMMNNPSEMRDLMNKIECLLNANQQQCYIGEMFNTALKQREELKNEDEPSISKETRELTATETRDAHRDNEQSGEEGINSKPDGETDVSETPELCDSSVISMNHIFPNVTIVLTGNSSAVQFGNENILLGEKQMDLENAEISSIVPVQRKISEHPISVINIIDFHEAEHVDHAIDKLINENEINTFILVVQVHQLEEAYKMGLEWLQGVFGDKVLQFVMILFTYETEEDCDTINDDLKNNPVLEQLLEKCGGRYQTCNKMMNNPSEMRDLMNKIECLLNANQQQCYTGEMFNTALKQREELKNADLS
ncbi:hypothetical protein Q8A67_007273 [Cirrhinus molitorella]|uniref:AIG1-type G domain-containing protein n=1 Tax=Cirrhinus molitorella TaxID=172907 RepID=A0AA88PY86_9TELE|nr:hypothetical protein Q8A67_007273 [Cirrhinus molitorella]